MASDLFASPGVRVRRRDFVTASSSDGRHHAPRSNPDRQECLSYNFRIEFLLRYGYDVSVSTHSLGEVIPWIRCKRKTYRCKGRTAPR